MKTKIIFTFLFLLSFFAQQSQSLQWVKGMGGTLDDYGTSITTDVSGNVYTTGYFRGTVDFDPSAGVYTLTSAGSYDSFISKLDAAGNFVWAIRFGGINQESSEAITTDASGNVYTTGRFMGTVDFDPGAGTFTLASSGSAHDAYISKLDASGNFVFAKKIGGTFSEMGNAIVLDAAGNIYTAGSFQGTCDFDPGTGTYTLAAVPSSGSGDDIYVSKLDASGNFVWAKGMGSSNGDIAMTIALDASGNVYTAGRFAGTTDFDPGPGTYTLATAGGDDIFISKLDASGNFIWAKAMGGSSNEICNAIAIDAGGNVYTTGSFQTTADFDPSAASYTLVSAGVGDLFVSKLDALGNFVWAKAMGSNAPAGEVGEAIEVGPSGNIYTAGAFGGTVDFDPGLGTYTISSLGTNNIFISELDAAGNFVSAKTMGGAGFNVCSSISIDATCQLHATGYFNGTSDFDPDAGVVNLTSLGNTDIFVLKLNGCTITGIKEGEHSLNNYVTVFPNPSAGIFQIYNKGERINAIEIYNMLGENIYSSSKTSDIDLTIDVSNQAAGIYFIKIIQGFSHQTIKIVKD